MNFKMDNRQTRRMLEKMGMNLEELPNVEEVIIKTKERSILKHLHIFVSLEKSEN